MPCRFDLEKVWVMARTIKKYRSAAVRFPPGAEDAPGGACTVAGVDEAGVGPWAGPVVAAAVYFVTAVPDGIADSKVLPAGRRELLYEAIMATGQVGIGIADVERIERDNVLAASHWAMKVAVGKLPKLPDLVLIDGLNAPDLGCPCRAVVGGDGRFVSIAAASIIAKVTRDRLMSRIAILHPGYGFERHKGYGTEEHRRALERLGVASCHRRTFKPVKAILDRYDMQENRER